jgi:hypothetical protein
VGARKAKGNILLFSESHCVPAADCLEEMRAFLDDKNMGGASCASIAAEPERNTNLQRMEHQVFEEGFAAFRTGDHWLKVLVHGFAIRRGIYEEVGEFEYRHGQFAEWALAAKLHSKGIEVGRAEKSRVYHYYSSDLGKIEEFIGDFTSGEISYRESHPAEYCERYFGMASEWSRRESFRRTVARLACQTVFRGKAGLRAYRDCISQYGTTTLWGIDWHIYKARLATRFSKAMVYCCRFWPKRRYRAYRDHWEKVINYYRLKAIAAFLSKPRSEMSDADHDDLITREERLIGFDSIETYKCESFRWCKPVSMIEIGPRDRAYELELQILDFRPERLPQQLLVLLDGEKILQCKTNTRAQKIRFRVESESSRVRSGQHYVTLVCNTYQPKNYGSGDSRTLGLPISSIRLSPVLDVAEPGDVTQSSIATG